MATVDIPVRIKSNFAAVWSSYYKNFSDDSVNKITFDIAKSSGYKAFYYREYFIPENSHFEFQIWGDNSNASDVYLTSYNTTSTLIIDMNYFKKSNTAVTGINKYYLKKYHIPAGGRISDVIDDSTTGAKGKYAFICFSNTTNYNNAGTFTQEYVTFNYPVEKDVVTETNVVTETVYETEYVPVYEVEEVQEVAENITQMQAGSVLCLSLICGLVLALVVAYGLKNRRK